MKCCFQSHVLGLAPGIIPMACSPTLAQSTQPGTSSQNAPEWRFDAGASVLANLDSTSWFRGVPFGGWFTAGSGTFRVMVDYWNHREQGLDSRTGADNLYLRFPYRESMSLRYLQAAFTAHFRTDRRLTPHVLVGGGHNRIVVEQCSGRNTQSRQMHCDGSAIGTPILMAGAGIDVSLGSRFLVRSQFRGFLPVGKNAEFFRRVQSARSQLLFGGGVRF